MATKTLKVKQIAFDKNNTLHAVADDGSIWMLDSRGGDWIELASIEVEEDAGEES